MRPCDREEDFIWLVKLGLGEWVGQNILTALKAAVEIDQVDTVKTLLEEKPISDQDLEELKRFATEVNDRSGGNTSYNNCWFEIRVRHLERQIAQIWSMLSNC